MVGILHIIVKNADDNIDIYNKFPNYHKTFPVFPQYLNDKVKETIFFLNQAKFFKINTNLSLVDVAPLALY